VRVCVCVCVCVCQSPTNIKMGRKFSAELPILNTFRIKFFYDADIVTGAFRTLLLRRSEIFKCQIRSL